MKIYLLLLSSIITIGFTVFFSLLPLNGLSQADVSNLYPTYITPIGFTFSIWSLIYLAWITIGVYSIIKKGKNISKKEIYLLSGAELLSVIWLIPYHYKFITLTLILIILILGILYYLIINPSKNKIFNIVTETYFGWIFIATLLNVHLLLVFYNNYNYGTLLGVVSIIIGVLANMYLLKKYSTFISSIILIWALMGIIISQNNVNIILTCKLGIIILLVTIINKKLKIKK